MRARRNCSSEETFETECKNLYQTFVDRGYPKKHLKRAYWRVKYSEREELLKEGINTKTLSDSVMRCIGTFDSYNTEIMGILRRHWPIFMADNDLKEKLGKYPCVTYRRGQNLKEYLVRSLYQEKREEMWLRSKLKGSYPCGGCSFCSFLPKIKEFTIPRENNKKIELREYINCKSTGIIYAATCTCLKLYIGKTIQPFRRRISRHISAIRRGEETLLARHVRDYHHGYEKILKFWGITQIWTKSC